ncbi:LytTR family transcriptional regulator DNA-binding domain-containing protein [Cohnella nanjingensis]|uniref:LytTR family transcriptional regulator DNA-binding domain-containing protein n=1 Tax=Cohnella nanjingensis TaxID=1387779 RepID=A0A7X0RPX8_9BACL|nr:LytTR family transcriptional regulator DNA-binding domain-containing protein [Cohnella nanjingensis]MBB6671405.1 LytTR family transcriptional regulator DNA-binding domain-containing protein [Cohnella nanjingensis]
MDVALRLYDSFEPRSDAYFFRVGAHGLVCFHGRNYNIKKRMSADETTLLTQDAAFVRISSDCYVNVSSVLEIAEDCICFGEGPGLNNRLPVSRRKQQLIRQAMNERPAAQHTVS